MPDITMCKDAECPLSTMCYRFTSTPIEYQSYFAESPRLAKWQTQLTGDICHMFWGEASQQLYEVLQQIVSGEQQTKGNK